jgi:uncharacterized membrane protein
MLHKPLASVFMAMFFAFTLFFFFMVEFNLIALAFLKIGIPAHYVFSALFATLLGSFVNIPVKKIHGTAVVRERGTITFFGFQYVIPRTKRNVTVIAVNLGGAVFPVVISGYLLLKTGLYFSTLTGVVFMTAVCYRLARPINGVGIALPFFVPPVLAALLSVMISHNHAPVIAYVSGTLGALIGADLLNLKQIGKLNAPVASIGGAGTFDGIFLTGILAVLLSVFLS